MKKTFIICLLGFFLLGLMTSPGFSQTAKEILEKMIETQGGRQAIEKIKNTTLTGSMEMIPMGMSGVITIYQKEPNKMRVEIEIAGMMIAQGFDGKTAWVVNPQTSEAQEMPEKQAEYFRRQSLGNHAFLHPEKYGITYAFKGKEKIEDKEYLVLEQTYSDGYKVTLYVDPLTYLAFKTKGITLNQVGVEVEAETYVSDYKKVDGIMIAHSMVNYQDGEEYMRMTIDEVVFNSDLEDALFSMGE